MTVHVHCDSCRDDSWITSAAMWVVDLGHNPARGHVAEALYTCPLCGDIAVHKVGSFTAVADLIDQGAAVSRLSTVDPRHPSTWGPR